MPEAATRVPIRYTHSQVLCPECGMAVRDGETVGGMCPPCAGRRGAESNRRKRADIRAGRDRFFDKLTTSLAKAEEIRDESLIVKTMRRVLTHEKIGGTDGLGDKFAEYISEVLEAEAPSRSLQLRVFTLLHKYQAAFDEVMRVTVPDLSGLDPEDLKATLVGLAMELVEQDEDVQDAIVPEFLARRPDVLERLGYVRVSGEVIEA